MSTAALRLTVLAGVSALALAACSNNDAKSDAAMTPEQQAAAAAGAPVTAQPRQTRSIPVDGV